MPYYPRRYLKKNLIIALLFLSSPVLLFFLLLDGQSSSYVKVQPLELPNTVVHIDLKGSPPKLEYLESLLPIFKEYGVNGLLMEYEDMFPYENQLKVVRAINVYAPQNLSSFLKAATSMGLQIIPVVQTFGHLEFILKRAEFRHLREDDAYPDSICPSNKESQILIAEMLKQIIEFHKSIAPIKYLHIGCDEVFHMNECEKCKSKHASNMEIFAKHVKFVKNTVRKLTPGTNILMWDDMMRGTTEDKIKFMDMRNIEPVYWDYSDTLQVYHSDLVKYLGTFDGVWIASAFKGADGRAATVPKFNNRFDNHLSWLKLLSQYTTFRNNYKFQGIILTGWSRYTNLDVPCETLQTSLHGLLLNLRLIQKFKEGFCLTSQKNRSMELFQAKYDAFDCSELPNSPLLAPRCDSLKLIALFLQLETFRNEVNHFMYGDDFGLSTIEFYGDSHINLNFAHDIVKWCTRINYFVNIFEFSVRNLMAKAYEKEFIDEYLNLKLYNIVKRVNEVLDATKKAQSRRIWIDDKPKILNLNNLTQKLDFGTEIMIF